MFHLPTRQRGIFVAVKAMTRISRFVDDLRTLLGRTLVLVAHPDDEAVGCGALLQRMADPLVVFATDGAPRSEFFWENYGSREDYALTRFVEADTALKTVGVRRFRFLLENDAVVDQELFLNLEGAYEALRQVIEVERPSAILSMAYEGGHPDHDSCCFLASVAAEQINLPLWEMPLYHRRDGQVERQKFLNDIGGIEIDFTREELVAKMNMFAAYDSQAEVLREFLPYMERFRPMKAYDFSQAPHAGVLNYEAWQWPMKGKDLCQAFARFAQSLIDAPDKREPWGTAA
jgi:LmbE family N-acetylglucosaminyl deacetylase